MVRTQSSQNRSAAGASPQMIMIHSRTGAMAFVSRWIGSFELLDTTTQFTVLSVVMFVTFGVHNVLQEAMLDMEGFTYGVMLGYMEVLGVTICSYLERKYVAQEEGMVAPLSAYPLLTACLLSSSGLCAMSLNYINFPTKVVFRSCKLVPTMLISTIVNKRVFSSVEYMCALAVCTGLVLFAAADWTLAPSFHPIGLCLVSASVVADAMLPNAQERLFQFGASRLEVTYYTNSFTLVAMTAMTLCSGDLMAISKRAMQDHVLATYMLLYTFISYIAISAYMNLVKRFGGVSAVLMATARKGMTLILSFVLFPKAFSWLYLVGAMLVLGGLLIVSLTKAKKRRPQLPQDDKVPLIKEEDIELQDDDNNSHHSAVSTCTEGSSPHQRKFSAVPR